MFLCIVHPPDRDPSIGDHPSHLIPSSPLTVRECSCDALLPACHACMHAGRCAWRPRRETKQPLHVSFPAGPAPSAASVYVVARGRTHAGGASEPVVRQRRRTPAPTTTRASCPRTFSLLATGERWRRGGMACLPACPVQLDSSPMLLATVLLASVGICKNATLGMAMGLFRSGDVKTCLRSQQGLYCYKIFCTCDLIHM